MIEELQPFLFWLFLALTVVVVTVALFRRQLIARLKGLTHEQATKETLPLAHQTDQPENTSTVSTSDLLTLPKDKQTWRVLVVDDLPVWADTITHFATLFDCEVRLATTLSAAARDLARWQPHLIILDLHMPRDSWQPTPQLREKYGPHQKSLAFCEQVTSHPKLSDVIVAVATVEEQPEQQVLARQAGAHYFYNKADFTVAHFEDLLARTHAAQFAA